MLPGLRPSMQPWKLTANHTTSDQSANSAGTMHVAVAGWSCSPLGIGCRLVSHSGSRPSREETLQDILSVIQVHAASATESTGAGPTAQALPGPLHSAPRHLDGPPRPCGQAARVSLRPRACNRLHLLQRQRRHRTCRRGCGAVGTLARSTGGCVCACANRPRPRPAVGHSSRRAPHISRQGRACPPWFARLSQLRQRAP